MRGKLSVLALSIPKYGITPAGAGKTIKALNQQLSPWDHPRRCGENSDITSQRSYKSGSPPQVRGKPLQGLSVFRARRITPAGAGKTSFPAKDTARLQDHPRRCGENRTDCYDVRLRKGSPPQVRGKLSSLFALSILDRITPAGAGKTKTMVLLWVKS